MKLKILKFKNKNFKFREAAGFTLVEMIVAIFAFGILITMVAAGFVQSLKIQRRAFNIQKVQEDMNFVLEFIARETRVGEITNSIFNPSCPDTTPTPVLCIDHPVNGTIIYSLSNNAVHRSVNGVDTVLSSNNVEFTRFGFYIQGATIGDDLQPRTTVVASARSKDTTEQITIDAQTTVSQRLLSD
ncbi:MAG: type II secretion system protein [bacterium]|nr:type II secretion system protein [bacterium]